MQTITTRSAIPVVQNEDQPRLSAARSQNTIVQEESKVIRNSTNQQDGGQVSTRVITKKASKNLQQNNRSQTSLKTSKNNFGTIQNSSSSYKTQVNTIPGNAATNKKTSTVTKTVGGKTITTVTTTTTMTVGGKKTTTTSTTKKSSQSAIKSRPQ